MTVRYRFTGRAGEYLNGVPAKDLTDDEAEALSLEQRGLLKLNLDGPAPMYEVLGRPRTALPKMPEPMATRDLVTEGDPNYAFRPVEVPVAAETKEPVRDKKAKE
jgi:hypothetical protein